MQCEPVLNFGGPRPACQPKCGRGQARNRPAIMVAGEKRDRQPLHLIFVREVNTADMRTHHNSAAQGDRNTKLMFFKPTESDIATIVVILQIIVPRHRQRPGCLTARLCLLSSERLACGSMFQTACRLNRPPSCKTCWGVIAGASRRASVRVCARAFVCVCVCVCVCSLMNTSCCLCRGTIGNMITFRVS